jgi:hypothetical protein
VYNSTLGAVFHINGGSKNVDSKVPLPGLGPADQVAQDDRHGYVVDRRNGRIIVFGKATLSVESTLSVGTSERPVMLEVAGGPYLVYQHGGTIVRLGQPPATIAAGGQLSTPIATTDGTVWVQQSNTGQLCSLRPRSAKLSCPVRVPGGHRGTLTALDDRPAFMDLSTGAVRLVTSHGLSRPTPLGVSVPAQAQVSDSDAGGRLAVLSKSKQGASLVLVDTSTVGSGKAAAAPITVSLGNGQFEGPVTSGGAVVMVDQTTRRIVTYDNGGARKAAVTAPAGSGTLQVSRGEDGRVYIDNETGTKTFIVDGDGSVTSVLDNDNGPGKPSTGAKPPVRPKPGRPAPGPTHGPSPPPSPTQPPPVQPTMPPPPPPATPAPSAQVPDAPATVQVSAGTGSATVSWTAPSDNGSALTSYLVSWQTTSGGNGGSVTVPAGTLQATITSLAGGTGYVIRVAARNDVGLGPSTASDPFTTKQVLAAPTGVQATAHADGSVTIRWQNLASGGATRFVVTASDGRVVARTSDTQATATGLTLGQPISFTVSATDSSARTLSTRSGTVIPYTAAAAPTGLKATPGRGQVTLTWAAPQANGGRIVGYTVSASGGPRRTVGTTAATVTGLRVGAAYTFTVRALTQDPNGSGTRLSGAPVSVSARAVNVPIVTIQAAWFDNNNNGALTMQVHVDDGGSPATCEVTMFGITVQNNPCANGDDLLVVTNVDGGHNHNVPVSVTGVSAAGRGPTATCLASCNDGPQPNSNGARSLPPARVHPQPGVGAAR